MQFRDRTSGLSRFGTPFHIPSETLHLHFGSVAAYPAFTAADFPIMFSSWASGLHHTVFLNEIFSSRQQTTSLCMFNVPHQ